MWLVAQAQPDFYYVFIGRSIFGGMFILALTPQNLVAEGLEVFVLPHSHDGIAIFPLICLQVCAF